MHVLLSSWLIVRWKVTKQLWRTSMQQSKFSMQRKIKKTYVQIVKKNNVLRQK